MTTRRVAGTDPGTASLDVLVLHDGQVADQVRFAAADLAADPVAPVRWLEARGPVDLVAAPSGYGLPLVPARELSDEQRRLLTLTRYDDATARGVAGFSRLIDAFCASSLPALFLPGVIHLPTVPRHRKRNRIDLGTADKLCVAALAVALGGEAASFCLVELGSAFTACLLVSEGAIVDGLGGTCGPPGWGSSGGWDGEAAYLLGPLSKDDLFRGGVSELAEELRGEVLAEGVVRAVAGLLAVTDVSRIVLSGRLLETRPAEAQAVEAALARLRPVERLGRLPGAWVKHAAQGSALLADGLLFPGSPLVRRLRLTEAAGRVLDGLPQPRGASGLSR